MTENQDQEKKIIVDEDWKAEAKKEKEKLAAEEKQAPEEQGRPPLPEGNLAALVGMLATQTMLALGVFQMEGQEPREPDLDLARYYIDMLSTLAEKTTGNLEPDEQNGLKQALNELRMAYVQLSGQE